MVLGEILDESTGVWKMLSLYGFKLLGGLCLLLYCNFDDNVIKRDFVGKIPTFYIEILKAWYMLKGEVHPDINLV